MLENLPLYTPLAFGLTTLTAFFLFSWIVKTAKSQTVRNNSTKIIFGLLLWLTIQAALTIKNIYNSDANSFPPKILMFGILPPLLTIIALFLTKNGRQFIDSLPLKNITYLNIIRIPVEIVLFWLFLNKAIPGLMTFEGRNFDIIAGITAPVIAYFGLEKGQINRRIILIWNFICLGLLINIVVNAFLSTPSPVQKFAFEQPNIAILSFPFSWLPTFIVHIVLLGHLVSIRKLLKH